jgi:hypothetical protein
MAPTKYIGMSSDCATYIKKIQKIKTSQNIAPKKATGYIVFCKENKEKIEKIEKKGVIRELSVQWKALSDDDKKIYKDKAIKNNKIALEKYEEDKVDDDEDIMELKLQIDEIIEQFLHDKKIVAKKVKKASKSDDDMPKKKSTKKTDTDDETDDDTPKKKSTQNINKKTEKLSQSEVDTDDETDDDTA